MSDKPLRKFAHTTISADTHHYVNVGGQWYVVVNGAWHQRTLFSDLVVQDDYSLHITALDDSILSDVGESPVGSDTVEFWYDIEVESE